MTPLSIFAPAKLNLFLAITGRRDDGFHDLVSVVAKLDFGDTLTGEPGPPSDRPRYQLDCDDASLPVDESNLVLKAAKAFAQAVPDSGSVRFSLQKRVPAGAGLGGGSSDAVAALRLLNRLAGERLSAAELARVAAQIGSDCPLFLHDGPVIMRGRGERVEPLPPGVAARVSGRRVLIFKPGFAIATPWTYGRLAAGAPQSYLAPSEAERRLAAWNDDGTAPAEALLFNNMEPPVFAKFVALPVLFENLRDRFGLIPRMCGSGSACFALVREDTDTGPISASIREAWGESAFVMETRLA